MPSGSRTKLGELVLPRKVNSRRKSSLMDALPWSWRMARLPKALVRGVAAGDVRGGSG
jgi:hypothetical protein